MSNADSTKKTEVQPSVTNNLNKLNVKFSDTTTLNTPLGLIEAPNDPQKRDEFLALLSKPYF